MRIDLGSRITLHILLGLASVSSAGAQAQIPPNVEFRVPKAPTLATGDSTPFLGYELHISNLTPSTMVLRRVEVLDGANPTRVLYTLQDSALLREITRLGPQVPAADRATIVGGLRAAVYMWISLGRGDAPTTLRHRLTLDRVVND